MSAFKVVLIPPPIRDHIVGLLLRCGQEHCNAMLAYEQAVKNNQPREHLINELRRVNVRHEALADVLLELSRYNDRIRANIADIAYLQKERFNGRVAEA